MNAPSSIAPVPRISLRAFYEDPATRDLLQRAMIDPRMARVQMDPSSGGLTAAAQAMREGASPNLLMIESRAPRRELLLELDTLADHCDEATKIILLGEVNDIHLYRDLMRRGVSEYLVHPCEPAELVRVIAQLYADPAQRLIGRVIAVCGVKGGVGSSTIAHHMAVTIGRSLHQPVIVIDLDMPFGTGGLNFNQELPSTLADAIEDPERIDSVFIERLLVRCEEHVSLLASPAVIEAAHDLTEDVFDPVLDAARMLAPYVILDLPHGWSDWKRRIILTSDEVVLVSEPDLAGLRNAKNIVDFLRVSRPNDLLLRLVLNKSAMPKRSEIPAGDFERALAIAPLANLPFDARLFSAAANSGKVLMDVEGSAKINDLLRKIISIITGLSASRDTTFSFISPVIARLRNALPLRMGR